MTISGYQLAFLFQNLRTLLQCQSVTSSFTILQTVQSQTDPCGIFLSHAQILFVAFAAFKQALYCSQAFRSTPLLPSSQSLFKHIFLLLICAISIILIPSVVFCYSKTHRSPFTNPCSLFLSFAAVLICRWCRIVSVINICSFEYKASNKCNNQSKPFV
jgi:hypothetical protein